LKIDLAAAIQEKMRLNAAKYPVEKSKGHARKYDQL
jgi:dCTP diphosphatase